MANATIMPAASGNTVDNAGGPIHPAALQASSPSSFGAGLTSPSKISLPPPPAAQGSSATNPHQAAGQLGNGVPGEFPLPNKGQPGTAYNANKLHPAALAAMSPLPSPLSNQKPK